MSKILIVCRYATAEWRFGEHYGQNGQHSGLEGAYYIKRSTQQLTTKVAVIRNYWLILSDNVNNPGLSILIPHNPKITWMPTSPVPYPFTNLIFGPIIVIGPSDYGYAISYLPQLHPHNPSTMALPAWQPIYKYKYHQKPLGQFWSSILHQKPQLNAPIFLKVSQIVPIV